MFKAGDTVGYKSSLKDDEFSHVGEVTEVFADGIPSFPRPCLTIQGKSGIVSAANCTKIPQFTEAAGA